MNKCPKCGHSMMALFQIPKCERCELGGPDIPQYWIVGNLNYMERYREAHCTVFEKKEMAQRWAKYIQDTRGLDVAMFLAQAAACNKVIPPWETVGESDHVIAGAKHRSCLCFLNEESASRADSAPFKLVRVK